MLRPGIIAIPEGFGAAGHDRAKRVMAWIEGSDPSGLQRLIAPHAIYR